MMPETVAAASSTEPKASRSVRTAGGLGVSFTRTSVTMPRVPSEPTMTPRRSSPIGSGLGLPSTTTSPSAVTTSTPRTWFTVVPSARQWRPPELLATFPPIVQTDWDDGSGTKYRPEGAVKVLRSWLMTPGCAHTIRFSTSTSPIRFIRVVTIRSA